MVMVHEHLLLVVPGDSIVNGREPRAVLGIRVCLTLGQEAHQANPPLTRCQHQSSAGGKEAYSQITWHNS